MSDAIEAKQSGPGLLPRVQTTLMLLNLTNHGTTSTGVNEISNLFSAVTEDSKIMGNIPLRNSFRKNRFWS